MRDKDDYIVRPCKVVMVDDNKDALRIKVKIPGIDDRVSSVDNLPWCIPLLPRMLHINPKKDECVMVFLSKQNDNGDRFFVGPVISQQQEMEFSEFNKSMTLFNGLHVYKQLPSPFLDADNAGTLPDRDDVAIEGRGNSDIVLKMNELRMRCGYKEVTGGNNKISLRYNAKTSAYIQMKFLNNFKYTDKQSGSEKKVGSVVNVVADCINLLGNTSKGDTDYGELLHKIGGKNNQSELLIDDETLKKILETAHPLPYGDLLIEYLTRLVTVFLNHSHPFPKEKPDLDSETIDSIKPSLMNEFLSPAIKIN